MKRRIKPRNAIKLGLFIILLLGVIIYLLLKRPDFAAIAYPPIPTSHFRFIDDAVEHCKVPRKMRGFIAAVAYAESTFHEKSQSGAGAVGVMQLLRATGFGVAQKYQIGGLNASTFTDPAISYKMGTCYIHYMMDQIGGNYEAASWDNEKYLTAIMVGYNAGPARGRSYIQGGYNGPASSLGYARKILQAQRVYNLDFARYDEGTLKAEDYNIRSFVWKLLKPDPSDEDL